MAATKEEAIAAQLEALERELARASDPTARTGSAHAAEMMKYIMKMPEDAAAMAGMAPGPRAAASRSEEHKASSSAESAAGSDGAAYGIDQREALIVTMATDVQSPPTGDDVPVRRLRPVEMSRSIAAVQATCEDSRWPASNVLLSSPHRPWVTTGMYPQALYLTLRHPQRIGRVVVSVAGARVLTVSAGQRDAPGTVASDAALRAELRRAEAQAAGVAEELLVDGAGAGAGGGGEGEEDAAATEWAERVPVPDAETFRLLARASIARAAAEEITTVTVDVTGVKARHLRLVVEDGWDEFCVVHHLAVSTEQSAAGAAQHSPTSPFERGLPPSKRLSSRRRSSKSFQRIN